jgi:putative methionine-R-sulfoxide reductase with GAF domain
MLKLHVIEGPLKGHSFDLHGETTFVGRSSRNDIQIEDPTLSRKQLKIFRIGKTLFIEDLKSTNGTRINGRFIEPGESFEVQEGDTLSMGNTVMHLGEVAPVGRVDAPEPVPATFSGEVSSDSGQAEERRSRSNKSLDLIYKVTEVLRQSLDIEEILTRVVSYLFDTLPRIDRVAIFLFERDGGMKQAAALSRADYDNGRIPYSRPVLERIAKEGKAVRMSNTNYEPPIDFSEDMETLKIQSVLCVPLISNSKVWGALYVDSLGGPYGFRREDLLLLNSLSGPVAVAIEKAQLMSIHK